VDTPNASVSSKVGLSEKPLKGTVGGDCGGGGGGGSSDASGKTAFACRLGC